MSTRSRIEMESHKDPHTLEREIDTKRAEIRGAVEALEHKLSPGELFERALGFARGNGREFVDNLGASVKANPVPMLLTSVGLLWMMASQHSGRSLPASASAGAWPAARQGGPGLAQRAKHAGERAAEKLGSAREHLGETREHLGERMHHSGEALRHRADHARQGFDTMLSEQPLAIGAMGIALGALLGALLPTTQREDQLLGSASERLRGKARDLAGEGLERASDSIAQRSNGRHSARDGAGASPAL